MSEKVDDTEHVLKPNFDRPNIMEIRNTISETIHEYRLATHAVTSNQIAALVIRDLRELGVLDVKGVLDE